MSATPAWLQLDSLQDSWEGAGHELAVRLELLHAATIVGDDADCVAHVALGAARASYGTRRVVIADLLGVATALTDLAGGQETAGLTDGFGSGQSLGEIARPVSGSTGIFILPSGRGPITADLVESERWQQIVDGFSDLRALLLVVARPSTPSLVTLARRTIGVIAVDVPAASLAGTQVLMSLNLQRSVAADVDRDLGGELDRALARAQRPSTQQSSPSQRLSPRQPTPWSFTPRVPMRKVRPLTVPGGTAALRRIAPAAPAQEQEHRVSAILAPKPTPAPSSAPQRLTEQLAGQWSALAADTRQRITIGACLTLGVLLIAGVWSIVRAPSTAKGSQPAAVVAAANSTQRTAGESAARPNAVPTAPASATSTREAEPRATVRSDGLVAGTTSADSAIASVYAVELLDASDVKAARLALRDTASWPVTGGRVVGSVFPVVEDGSVSYKVFLGAWRSRDGATDLLSTLRDRRVITQGAGRAARVPYALLLTSNVMRDLALAAVASWRARGVYAYALTQYDGSARVYAGAFESPAQASALAATIRAAGGYPTLAYRVGGAW
jgi:hypothetical protein